MQVWYSAQCYEQFMGIPIALRTSDARDVMMTSYVRGSDAPQGLVTVLMYDTYLLTYADVSRVDRVFSGVCVFVCLFVCLSVCFSTRHLKTQNPMQLRSPNLTEKCSATHGNSFIIESKGQSSGRRGTKSGFRRGFLHSCERWLLLVNSANGCLYVCQPAEVKHGQD